MCLPLMESEQEFLYQFFVRNVLPPSELNSNSIIYIPPIYKMLLSFLKTALYNNMFNYIFHLDYLNSFTYGCSPV